MFPLKDENPSQTFPYFTVSLIGANILVFFVQVYFSIQGMDITRVFGMRPVLIVNEPTGYHFLTILSSMFLHANLLHILGNMWFFWIFGNNVEDALGHFRFLLFYLLSGVGAAIVHIASSPSSYLPTIGASGAISGVLGAYVLLYPRARIVTLIPIFFIFQIIRIPAFFFLGFWFLYQFIGGTATSLHTGGGIAWFAHVGGFISGMVLVKLIPKRKGFRNYQYGY